MQPDAKMDDMTMPGMSMPSMAGAASSDENIILAASQARVPHPSVGIMGPCEHQSCDQDAASTVKLNRAVAPQLHANFAAAHFIGVDGLQFSFSDSYDGIGAFRRSWSLTRWAILVLSIGCAIALSIAIAISFVLNLLKATG